MTSTDCKRFEELLLEGDQLSMEEAARHAASCTNCGPQFAAWSDISATARTLHTNWKSDLLWGRIDRAMRRERRPRPRLWQVAAAAILTLGLGIGTWFGMQRRDERAAFDQAILKQQAVAEVETAEKAHLEAINRLQKMTTTTLEEADTALMVSYREKLMLLDDAINECQSNIRHNRQNAHLRKQLLAVYSEKQRTLQDVLHEETNHVSNQ